MKRSPGLSIALLLLGLCLASGCKRESAIDSTKPGVENSKQDSAPEQVADDKSVPKSVDVFRFDEVASQSGINFVGRTGSEANKLTMIETLGTGVAIVDTDRDGRMDLFFSGGGSIKGESHEGRDHGLFRNVGSLQFQNVSASAKIATSDFYSHAVVIGDYDHDGFEDVLITGYGGVQFLRNQGDGTMLPTNLPGIDESDWSCGAAFADINGDQLLDLYIANYVDWSWENNPHCNVGNRISICPPRMFEGIGDALYFNNGDGTFADVTETISLEKSGKGLGVIACDIDQDSDIDIYVGNDTDPNFLYINDGTGKLKEVANERGVAVGGDGTPNGSMGVALCDCNNDQQFDLWVTNFRSEPSALYRNLKENFFLHSSFSAGVSRMGDFVGWGTVWSDFDLDGDEDVFVANGHVYRGPSGKVMRQSLLLLENDTKRLTRIQFESSTYLKGKYWARGVAAGDLDNDGDVDLVVTHTDEPVAVLRNEVKKSGDSVCVELIGRHSNRFAIGATLTLETDKEKFVRQIVSAGTYISSSDRRVFWGLPRGSKVTSLTVKWPSGTLQRVKNVKVNQPNVLVEAPNEANAKPN